ncbi:MAG: hypothetical protein D6E12_18880 [Desulfovibrio sp.]|nr:MAG: hypothetical protein D6E12_18880 [Desulfovibrio sp.]
MSEFPQDSYKVFHKAELILQEGKQNSVAYMVKQGSVVLYRVVDNRRVVLARMGPGRIFGEMALVTGEPTTFNAVAEEYTELIPFDRALLQAMLLKCPDPVQRILALLMEQLQTLHGLVHPEGTTDYFLSVSAILDLMRNTGQTMSVEGDDAVALSHGEFSRRAKDILAVSQLELDVIIQGLARLALIQLRENGAEGKTIILHASGDLLPKAREMREAVHDAMIPPYTEGLEFLDLPDMAQLTKRTSAQILALIAGGELPASLLAFPRSGVEKWLLEYEAPAKDTKRQRQQGENIVDDVVDIEDSVLQNALSRMDMDEISLLYAGADQAAREKILANLSLVMEEKVREQAKDVRVDITQLSKAEVKLFRILRKSSRR